MSYSRAVINDLDAMEGIVARRNDLEWDGWDVIHYGSKPVSFMKANAVFHKGQWRTSTRYPVNERGWVVPRWFTNVAG